MTTLGYDIEVDGRQAETEIRKVDSSLAKLKATGDRAATSIDKLNEEVKSAATGMAGADQRVRLLTSGMGALQASFGAFSALQAARQLVSVGIAADTLNRQFEAVFRSSNEAGRQMAFIRSEAIRLGLSVQSAANDFALLSASTIGTSLEGEKTRMIFSAIAEASAKLGLSAATTSGTLVAFRQIASGATLQTEELNQISERIPGTFRLAAAALGVTTGEVKKLIADGKVATDDFLPKFAEQLRRSFGTDATTRIESVTSNFARLRTEIELTLQESSKLPTSGLGNAAGFAADLLRRGRESQAQGREIEERFRTLYGSGSSQQRAERLAAEEAQQGLIRRRVVAATTGFNADALLRRRSPLTDDPRLPGLSGAPGVTIRQGLTGVDLLTFGQTPPKPGAVPRAAGSVGRARQLPTPQQFGPTAAEAAQALAYAERLQQDIQDRADSLARRAADELQDGPLAAGAAQRLARTARRGRRGGLGAFGGDLIEAQSGAAIGIENARFNSQVADLKGGTEESLRRDGRLKENETLNDLLQRAAEEHQAKLTEIEAEGQDARQQLMMRQLDVAAEIFGGLANLAQNFGRKGFAIYKAAAIAEATISTIKGAKGAFERGVEAYPPPFGPIAGAASAAIVTAAGFAQIAKIRSQQYGGGREFGGDVQRSRFYEIGEKGKPELVQSDGRYYLFGAQGNVIPANGGGGNASAGRDLPAQVNVYNTGGSTVRTETRRLSRRDVIDIFVEENADNASVVARSVQSRAGGRAQGLI